MEGAIVEAFGLEKRFGTTRALRGVDLSVMPGEVHGLIGANGAGKSTLINCLAGAIQPDAGQILVAGEPVRIDGPTHAARLGMSFIFQELAFAARMTVLENLAMGHWRRGRLGLLDWSTSRTRAGALAERLGFDFGLDTPVKALTTAQRGVLSIARALMSDARMIAMDEPTASLSSAESDRLFSLVRELSSDGVGIVYISHRLAEIEMLCDRVTVFRDGRDIARFVRGEFTETSLIELMAGSAPTPSPRSAAPQGEPVVLEVRGLTRRPRFEEISFELHRGEVLGLGGLVGSGRTEVLRAIFGADRPSGGTVRAAGQDLPTGSIVRAIRAGIALVPEERRSEGLMMRKSIQWNIAAPSWSQLRHRRLPFLNGAETRRRAEKYTAALSIKVENLTDPVANLSGGNQQKVVLAKWLSRAPRILLLDEPTRGVDVAARQEIFQLVRSMADSGVGVIVVSSELEELTICDRVLVMREGRLVGEITNQRDISEASILTLALAGRED